LALQASFYHLPCLLPLSEPHPTIPLLKPSHVERKHKYWQTAIALQIATDTHRYKFHKSIFISKLTNLYPRKHSCNSNISSTLQPE
jgi:hypothetical protein